MSNLVLEVSALPKGEKMAAAIYLNELEGKKFKATPLSAYEPRKNKETLQPEERWVRWETEPVEGRPHQFMVKLSNLVGDCPQVVDKNKKELKSAVFTVVRGVLQVSSLN